MLEELAQIIFESKDALLDGIEILRLEELAQRKEDIPHLPEKEHQLNFYMIVLYTEGETKQLVDFVWHKVHKNSLLYLTKGQVNAFKFNLKNSSRLCLGV